MAVAVRLSLDGDDGVRLRLAEAYTIDNDTGKPKIKDTFDGEQSVECVLQLGPCASKCRACGEKIIAGDPRYGVPSTWEVNEKKVRIKESKQPKFGIYYKYYHFDCYTPSIGGRVVDETAITAEEKEERARCTRKQYYEKTGSVPKKRGRPKKTTNVWLQRSNRPPPVDENNDPRVVTDELFWELGSSPVKKSKPNVIVDPWLLDDDDL